MLVALLLIWYALLAVDGWAVLLTALTFLAYLLAAGKNTPLLAFWAANTLFIAWKHRADLARFPHLRPWLGRLGGRG